jgi:hypothetical protein
MAVGRIEENSSNLRRASLLYDLPMGIVLLLQSEARLARLQEIGVMANQLLHVCSTSTTWRGACWRSVGTSKGREMAPERARVSIGSRLRTMCWGTCAQGFTLGCPEIFQICTRSSRPIGNVRRVERACWKRFKCWGRDVKWASALFPHKLINLILHHPNSFPFLADGDCYMSFDWSLNQIGKVQRYL